MNDTTAAVEVLDEYMVDFLEPQIRDRLKAWNVCRWVRERHEFNGDRRELPSFHPYRQVKTEHFPIFIEPSDAGALPKVHRGFVDVGEERIGYVAGLTSVAGGTAWYRVTLD